MTGPHVDQAVAALAGRVLRLRASAASQPRDAARKRELADGLDRLASLVAHGCYARRGDRLLMLLAGGDRSSQAHGIALAIRLNREIGDRIDACTNPQTCQEGIGAEDVHVRRRRAPAYAGGNGRISGRMARRGPGRCRRHCSRPRRHCARQGHADRRQECRAQSGTPLPTAQRRRQPELRDRIEGGSRIGLQACGAAGCPAMNPDRKMYSEPCFAKPRFDTVMKVARALDVRFDARSAA